MQLTKDRDYSEMERVLKPLGFKHLGGGQFCYELLDRTFDLSAASIEGIPSIIFSAGMRQGANNLKESFCNLFDLQTVADPK